MAEPCCSAQPRIALTTSHSDRPSAVRAVLHVWRHFREARAGDQPVTLKVAQGLGENLRGDARHRFAQSGEPQRTRLEGEDDEYGPLASEAIQSKSSRRADVVIRAYLLRHLPALLDTRRDCPG